MEFKEFSKILDKQQKLKAREATNSIDRAKTTLTLMQKINRYAQAGHILRYNKLSFIFEGGMGLLTLVDGKQILGATITDFANEIKKNYDCYPKWYNKP